MASDTDIIGKLKHEIAGHVATLKSSEAWVEFQRLYQALVTVEQVAGVRKTSLEEVLGLGGAVREPAPGEPQEREMIAEIEKGA